MLVSFCIAEFTTHQYHRTFLTSFDNIVEILDFSLLPLVTSEVVKALFHLALD